MVELCKEEGPEQIGIVSADDDYDNDTASVGSSNTSIGDFEESRNGTTFTIATINNNSNDHRGRHRDNDNNSDGTLGLI